MKCERVAKRSPGLGHWGPRAGTSISGARGAAALGPAPGKATSAAWHGGQLVYAAGLVAAGGAR